MGASRRFDRVYRRILVGYKDTEQGRDALALGQCLGQATHAEVLSATAPSEEGEGLAELARSEDADLIVLGSTHRGPIGRVLPGATAERLLGEAPCPVAIAPRGFGHLDESDPGWRPLSDGGADGGMRVIGVGYDGSPAAQNALDVAAELAMVNDAALRVYTVATRVPNAGPSAEGQASDPARAEAMREKLHSAVAGLPREARALPVFLWGIPASELIGAAENGVDLMILGSRRRGPVRRALNGSVSSAVIREARCPVLITPTGVEAPSTLLV